MRAIALTLALAAAAPAQHGDPLGMLRQWIDSVDAHAPGTTDESLERITAWSTNDYDEMRPYVEALIEAPTDKNPARAARLGQLEAAERAAISDLRDRYLLKARFDQFRQRAAIFHTDAAILGVMPLVVDPAPSRADRLGQGVSRRQVDVRSADGLVDSFQLANPNWDYARDMLDAISIAHRAPVVPQWYRAIGAYYAAHDNLADASRHFERARRVVADDPGVLYGEACFQETLGSPSVQNFARVTTLPNGFTLLGVYAPATHFRNAESLLKRVLAIQPGFVEARLRLGRVVALLGQPETSLTHFAQVITNSSDPVLTYYAYLFAGDAWLALDRPADARVSYERALTAFPQAQAARIGLAAALRASGDRAGAVEAAMITLTVPPGTRDSDDDPWWAYYKGDAANVERLLDELRAPFARPAQ